MSRSQEARCSKSPVRWARSRAIRWCRCALAVSSLSGCTRQAHFVRPLSPAARDSLNVLLDHHAAVAVTLVGDSVAGHQWQVVGDTLMAGEAAGRFWRAPLDQVTSLSVDKTYAVRGMLIGFAGALVASMVLAAADPGECQPPVACGVAAGVVLGLPAGLLGAIVGASVGTRTHVEITGGPARMDVGVRVGGTVRPQPRRQPRRPPR